MLWCPNAAHLLLSYWMGLAGGHWPLVVSAGVLRLWTLALTPCPTTVALLTYLQLILLLWHWAQTDHFTVTLYQNGSQRLNVCGVLTPVVLLKILCYEFLSLYHSLTFQGRGRIWRHMETVLLFDLLKLWQLLCGDKVHKVPIKSLLLQ